MHEQATGPNPGGFCMCGCGERAPIAAYSHAARGMVKGQPRRYISGHNTCAFWKPDRYHEEDRGYSTPCWVWDLCVNAAGYGCMREGRTGRTVLAHRWYYETYVAPIPVGLDIDHLCRVHACVNPDHLEPVTAGENTRRGRRTTLTAAAVLAIRNRYALGEPSDLLAIEYDIGESAIRAAATGKTWRDVGGPIATPRRYQRRSASSPVSGG